VNYRTFGKTGWEVSEIGMGGSWFYGRPEEGLLPVSHGVEMVETALEKGVNYFDTAPLYGKGRSEEVMGVALNGVTEPYYLATKVGYFPEPFDYTRDTVLRGFDESLKRLNRDHVDLLQIHEAEKAGWDGIFGTGRALEAMLEIWEQGAATHLGLTGSDLGLMSRVLRETDAFVSVLTFCKYDLVTQEAAAELIPTAAERDIAVIAASPLHGGLLGSKRDQWVERGRFKDLHEKLFRVEKLLEDDPEGISRIGLRYLLSDPRIKIVLSGVANLKELDMSVSMSDGRLLSDDVIHHIEEA